MATATKAKPKKVVRSSTERRGLKSFIVNLAVEYSGTSDALANELSYRLDDYSDEYGRYRLEVTSIDSDALELHLKG